MQTFRPPRPHPRPPRPSPPQGYLIQKIIACERVSLPCVCAEWCFESCAGHAVRHIRASGTPVWTCDDQLLRVSIPVSVRLCDPCGRCETRSAVLELETDMPRHFLCALDDPRASLVIWPCVRLLHAECGCAGCCRVQAQVTLEICLTRCDTIHCGGCRPECPQLPLYPPPMC